MKRGAIFLVLTIAGFAAGWLARGIGIVTVTTGTETAVHGLHRFHHSEKRYPTTEEGLKVLFRTRPSSGPWLRQNEALLDVYGREIIYQAQGSGFILLSAGADGISPSADDVELAREPIDK